jgi:hypothetical protein
MWVVDHQRDLTADFRAIYHLAPAEALDLPGPEYLALAFRAASYQGSVANLVAREQQNQESQAKYVSPHSPEIADFIEFG